MDLGADGLRVRKKRETREGLHRAALDLVEEKGFAAVTTEEIAARAGVSTRTFFNYFSSKDAAVLGTGPEDLAEAAELLRSRPAEEPPLEALRRVAHAMLSPATVDPALRLQRRRVLVGEPSLAPAVVASNIRVENCLTEALATRLGDAADDLRVRLTVAAALAAVRASLEHHQNGASGSVEDSIDTAFALLAVGLGADESRLG
ncbi:MAG TPA: TetR family transcriptional regulator [Intrasporangium sp.]|uniref:TetR/AcrR family transcriptional regulator n=1 Tax=Intrasporangium sp. TaxID=1925024 RepID=UPI002D78E169|nr:TetR family transcriptional regulator [Intrasporangium sp.]HET7398290.1 TetR family transcriptional regulator [Intrasporangium sp.]